MRIQSSTRRQNTSISQNSKIQHCLGGTNSKTAKLLQEEGKHNLQEKYGPKVSLLGKRTLSMASTARKELDLLKVLTKGGADLSNILIRNRKNNVAENYWNLPVAHLPSNFPIYENTSTNRRTHVNAPASVSTKKRHN